MEQERVFAFRLPAASPIIWHVARRASVVVTMAWVSPRCEQRRAVSTRRMPLPILDRAHGGFWCPVRQIPRLAVNNCLAKQRAFASYEALFLRLQQRCLPSSSPASFAMAAALISPSARNRVHFIADAVGFCDSVSEVSLDSRPSVRAFTGHFSLAIPRRGLPISRRQIFNGANGRKKKKKKKNSAFPGGQTARAQGIWSSVQAFGLRFHHQIRRLRRGGRGRRARAGRRPGGAGAGGAGGRGGPGGARPAARGACRQTIHVQQRG